MANIQTEKQAEAIRRLQELDKKRSKRHSKFKMSPELKYYGKRVFSDIGKL